MKAVYFIPIIMITLMGGYFLLNKAEHPVTFMATTTTEDSGLLNILIPELEADTGLDIQVVTAGTGKVLRAAMDGNADIILVHDPISEEIFMTQGYGKTRLNIMQNDFVLIGPANDPADIKNSASLIEAFQTLSTLNEPFISRGDESGTHKAEMRIWQAAGFKSGEFSAANYIKTGAGMGRSLNIAAEKSAYILTDHATWITFQNKGSLTILKADDPLLINVYSLLTVNPDLHNYISEEKQNLILNWFKSDKSKKIINNYQYLNQKLFHSLL